MKYFMINGYIPSAHPPKIHGHGYTDTNFGRSQGKTRQARARTYKECGIELPQLGETIFMQHPKIGRISLFVYGAYDAFIMIVSSSQRNAYLLGNSLRAAMTCFHGNPPMEHTNRYLLELTKIPDKDMSHQDLVSLIDPGPLWHSWDNLLLDLELDSGTCINHIQLKAGCNIVAGILDHSRLLDALMHLEYSRNLIWGFMVGSYYVCHYSRDRKDLSRYKKERLYLENRCRYDSAFVSAFRGIECLLGKPYFKKGEISFLLADLDREFHTDYGNSRHKSFFEVFSSHHRWWKYEDLIAYYLKLRNAVSAHGNPSPPHIVMEDQVFEIQYLLQSMLGDILSYTCKQRIKSRNRTTCSTG